MGEGPGSGREKLGWSQGGGGLALGVEGMSQTHLWGSWGSVGGIWGHHVRPHLLPSQVLLALATGEHDAPGGTHCGREEASGLGLAAPPAPPAQVPPGLSGTSPTATWLGCSWLGKDSSTS